jgi:hypothetical protein
MVNDKDGPHGGPYGTGILGGHVVAMRTTKRVWVWLGFTALAFWAWMATEIAYRVVYVFRITDLNLLADGIQRVPYVVGALSLVWLIVFLALRRYRQLRERGFYIAFGASCNIRFWFVGVRGLVKGSHCPLVSLRARDR